MKTSVRALAFSILSFTFAWMAAGAVDDFTFLKSNMPPRDRGKVSDEYLQSHVKMAREALAAAPWKATIDEETFREYILPYSSIAEEVDDWRPLFRKTFWPMVKNCKTTTEAVQIINSKIWNTLNVHYDTRRDKADQSPFHSMRIHMASCTGLAIIQVDVYRACGIPARFVGCLWTPIPGNHSWPEYYDNGSWHFFGDAEADKILPPDKAWFTPYAAQANADDPNRWIYATRWSVNSDGLIWGAWGRPIPADNVTLSYKRFADKMPVGRVAVVLRNADGRRVATPVRFVSPDNARKVMAEGVTFDETHDLNDHLIVKLPEHTMAVIEAKQPDGTFKRAGYVEFNSKQQLVELKTEARDPKPTPPPAQASVPASSHTVPTLVWPEVTTTMKPWAINWWMGSAVDEAGLEYQCAEMERAHFGGFNVVHVYNDFKGNARKAGRKPFVPDEKCRVFMSDEWLEAWNMGVRIARSHHLGVDLSMCGGWCFGGPWVTEDDAATSKIPIHIPGPGGDGFHIDPFSATAMRHHLDRFEEAFGKNGLAERPRGFYHDSFEYYGAKPKQGDDIDEAELACFKVWTDWCRANGYETRQQAHGSPANWLDLYAQASIPETEMFGRKDKNRDILLSKFASSAAHLAGRKLVSAEACTWVDEHFQERPKDVKMMLDQMFLAGINHIFYHGCSYSPATAPWPGWCFFASLQMNPRNPLWREVRTLNDYVIRCQSIFQTWHPDNDLLVRWDPDEYRKAKPGRYGRFMTIHNGHEWFNPTPTGKRARALWNDGYQFDFVSDRQLAANPKLKARLDVAQAKPSPFTKATGLLSTRWTKDGVTLYFVVNHSGSARVLTGDFTLMDPMTGRIGRSSRHVLHPYASVFVSGRVASEVLKTSPKKLPFVTAAWRVTPVAGGPALPAATNLAQLVSWSTWDESFVGTMRYETTFDAPAEVQAGWSIDLGSVREAAHVWLNGQDLGAYLIPPYRCRIPGGLLQPKGNSLVVEATSLGANRIRHIYRTNGKWKEFADANFYNYDYHRFDATNWRVFPCGLTTSLQFVEPETTEVTWQARPKTIEKASWIWATGNEQLRAPAGIAYFRRAFDVDAKQIARAQVIMTADNKAEAWLNGVRIGATDPVRESWRHACKFDVTAQLKSGANLLAVKGENFADAGATNPAGLVLSLEIVFADGTRQLLVTDGAWVATTATVSADWMQPAFDASAWKPVPRVLPFNQGIWYGRVWW